MVKKGACWRSVGEGPGLYTLVVYPPQEMLEVIVLLFLLRHVCTIHFDYAHRRGGASQTSGPRGDGGSKVQGTWSAHFSESGKPTSLWQIDLAVQVVHVEAHPSGLRGVQKIVEQELTVLVPIASMSFTTFLTSTLRPGCP